ncbi:response regulator [uncultured Desulfuromonas sp.]|uniref:response regulator n=1 Tax=uncultured Desulfuromonas sp. TaxID=181013 RepID=UPI002639F001|nr:response regulator [uncultured Desulfuromonas sp.]
MATILLVDDVELFLEVEKSFLEDSGHTVVTAKSGEEALSKLDRVEPDLALLDLYLPEIDGDEVCRRLRAGERWRRLPVIMVTAAGKQEEILKCLDAGCDDYLTKPVNKKDLLEKVDRLLGAVRGRTASRTPVSLQVQIRGNNRSLGGYAQDISKNGIYVKSRTTLKPGTAVELQLGLPGGRQLPLLGKVKRVQKGAEPGLGIYFIHPEPEGLRALQELAEKAHEGDASAVQPAEGEDLREQNIRLLQRIGEMEEENREFADQIVRAEQVNNTLTNLYIAASKLHSVLDRGRVVDIVKEVVINLVGAEKFALLELNKNSGELRCQATEGFEDEEFPSLAPGEGVFGKVLSGGESFFAQGAVPEGSDDPRNPLAAIPLKIKGETLGVLAIYRLFVQKERFEEVDFQLFSMLAGHAATALFTATLYEASERKAETYRGVMDLLLR